MSVVAVEKSHGRVAIPEAERMDFVHSFHVRHGELQYRSSAVREQDGRYARATNFGSVEWRIDRQRPSALQVSQRAGQSVEPSRALWRFAAVCREPLGDVQGHDSFWIGGALGT